VACVFNLRPSHSLTRSPTHSLARLPTHSLSSPPSPPLQHSPFPAVRSPQPAARSRTPSVRLPPACLPALARNSRLRAASPTSASHPCVAYSLDVAYTNYRAQTRPLNTRPACSIPPPILLHLPAPQKRPTQQLHPYRQSYRAHCSPTRAHTTAPVCTSLPLVDKLLHPSSPTAPLSLIGRCCRVSAQRQQHVCRIINAR
jgi:hypothetical protein